MKQRAAFQQTRRLAGVVERNFPKGRVGGRFEIRGKVVEAGGGISKGDGEISPVQIGQHSRKRAGGAWESVRAGAGHAVPKGRSESRGRCPKGASARGLRGGFLGVGDFCPKGCRGALRKPRI